MPMRTSQRSSSCALILRATSNLVVTVHLATAARNFSAASTTFANNRGADFAQVYAGPVVTPAAATTVNVTFNTVFQYSPANSFSGGLLVEVRVPSTSTAAGGLYTLQWDTSAKGARINDLVSMCPFRDA